jgi:hypothetical protein
MAARVAPVTRSLRSPCGAGPIRRTRRRIICRQDEAERERSRSRCRIREATCSLTTNEVGSVPRRAVPLWLGAGAVRQYLSVCRGRGAAENAGCQSHAVVAPQPTQGRGCTTATRRQSLLPMRLVLSALVGATRSSPCEAFSPPELLLRDRSEGDRFPEWRRRRERGRRVGSGGRTNGWQYHGGGILQRAHLEFLWRR